MSTRWERLAGDTAVFAVKIALLSDPDEGRAASVEHAASWGALELWVSGRNITAHAHGDDAVGGIRWYLLPLLEWFADNWEPMFHEERLPARLAADDAATSLHVTRFPPGHMRSDRAAAWEEEWQAWWLRHSLQARREGGLVPDVVFRRFRDRVEISWNMQQVAGVPRAVRFFVPLGSERLSPAEVVVPLHTVLLDVAMFLRRQLPESHRLRRLVANLENIPLQATERQEERLAWLAGLGRTAQAVKDGWQRVVQAMHRAGRDVESLVTCPTPARALALEGSCHASLLFACLSPQVSEADVMTLARAMVEAHRLEAGAPMDRLQRESTVSGSDKPWEQGYELADELRQTLGMDEDVVPDIGEVLARTGVELKDVVLADASIHAVTLAGDGFVPTVLVNTNRPRRSLEDRQRRFTVAHELCHLLVDRDRGAKLAIASGPWAPPRVEKRARAFAAAFLMPEPLVKLAVSNLAVDAASLEGVRAMARVLEASELATLQRLHDLGFLDDVQRDSVLSEMEGVVAGNL
jgi:Zn-dependent peptidase ImmA (M78 family)